MATEKPNTDAVRDRSKLPLPELPFRGKIGKTYLESEMDWPRVPAPPEGAPNVVVILLDDVGFGQVSTFGGPVPTPALDKLAAGGLRYNRFHTTSICGPSRGAMLTGRNHHNCGSGFLVEWATGFPSYNCMIPKSTATIGEMLKGISAGFALHIQNGKLVYHYNWFERERTNLVSNIPVPVGKSTVTMEFAYDGGGLGKGGEAVIGINGKEVGRARIAHTVPGRFGIDTFGVGSDTGSPVSNTYPPPFPFTGTIERVDIELGPRNLSVEDENKLNAMYTAFAGTHD